MPIIQFKGKTAVENYHRVVPHHRLEIDAPLSIGKKPSLDGNLIIEGDNLLALKSLLPTHTGRIKCIYIDPPYNTGNEGWVYNDNLTQPQFKEWIGKAVGQEGEDACRHDKWCCMMYPRLQLLRDLLREDGAIFISIDDNEVHHLRMVMDEVFGEENFIATIIWHKMDSPKNTAIHFSEDHDYIVVYAKAAAIWSPNLLKRNEEMIARYKNPDNDARGVWLLSDLAARNPYSQGLYEIKTPSGKIIAGPPSGSYWRVSREKFDELDRDNRIWWGKGDVRPGIKRFLSEVREGVVPQTIWSWEDVGSTRNAKQDLSQLLDKQSGEDIFTTPKPVELLRRIANLASDKESIILDSFAGTGTTAHAVLELNKEDGGNRKFILVQQAFDTKENEAEKFNPHVLHAHWWMPGGWIASRLGLPFVVTCHGTDVRLLEKSYWRALAAPVMRRASAITTVSEFLASDLRRLMPAVTSKITVAPMPLDIERFASGASAPKVSPPRVLFAGNLIASKGVDVLINAVALLRDQGVQCQLRIIGAGPEEAKLHALAAQRALGDAVTWSPFISQHELPAEFGEATVTALVSRGQAEGLGLVLAEALLAGSAVVGTAAGGIPEVVVDEQTGLIALDGDAADLARQIDRLLADRALRDRTVEAGRARIRAQHAPVAAAERFIALYKEVAKGGSVA